MLHQIRPASFSQRKSRLSVEKADFLCPEPLATVRTTATETAHTGVPTDVPSLQLRNTHWGEQFSAPSRERILLARRMFMDMSLTLFKASGEGFEINSILSQNASLW